MPVINFQNSNCVIMHTLSVSNWSTMMQKSPKLTCSKNASATNIITKKSKENTFKTTTTKASKKSSKPLQLARLARTPKHRQTNYQLDHKRKTSSQKRHNKEKYCHQSSLTRRHWPKQKTKIKINIKRMRTRRFLSTRLIWMLIVIFQQT